MHRIVRHRQAAQSSRRSRFFHWSPAMAAMLYAGAFAADVSARPSAKVEVGITFELRLGKRAPPADIIANEYIVTFGNGIAGPALQTNPQSAALASQAVLSSQAAEARVEHSRGAREGNVVLYRYRTAIIGFAARLDEAALRDIGGIPGVLIEPNRRVAVPRDGVSDRLVAAGDRPVFAAAAPQAKMFSAPPPLPPPFQRGLDRIDRRLSKDMDMVFQARSTGSGVQVYVIDTGVLALHDEFLVSPGGSNSRVLPGFNATADSKGTEDCGNHGTGVASVIGGKTMGVAPGVLIIPVRVFPCDKSSSSIATMTKGVDWVTNDRASRLPKSPVVANVSFMTLSLKNTTLNKAVVNSITLGRIPYVVAAGNGSPNVSPNGQGNSFGVDACTVSPAAVLQAITVGNIKPENDRRMSDSNFGPCVDLFAPGLEILAASSIGPKARGPRDGTSFAAPHVTGVAALFLETKRDALPQEVRAAILKAAITYPPKAGIINRGGGSPNVQLHWGCGSADGVLDTPLLPKVPVAACIARKLAQ